MSEQNLQKAKTDQESPTRAPVTARKLPWEAPRMEDVSEEVMAQPYIRFT